MLTLGLAGMYRQVDGQMVIYERKDEQTDGQTAGWANGWMDSRDLQRGGPEVGEVC